MSNEKALARELNSVQGTKSWKGSLFGSPNDAVTLVRRGQIGARLQESGERTGHFVTIEPTANPGVFRVRDPKPGVTYDVTEDWIRKFVSGGVWQ